MGVVKDHIVFTDLPFGSSFNRRHLRRGEARSRVDEF